MEEYNLVLDKDEIIEFDYSIKPQLSLFFDKLTKLSVLTTSLPCSKTDVVVTVYEVLSKNIDDVYSYGNSLWCTYHINLTRAKKVCYEGIVSKIVYYVIEQYLCNMVDYIADHRGSLSSFCGGDHFEVDEDYVLNTEELKRMNFKTDTLEFRRYLGEREHIIDNGGVLGVLNLKQKIGMVYDDGDSSSYFKYYSTEDKRKIAVYVIKEWFGDMVLGLDKN